MSYALVKVKKLGQTVRLNLPFSIGSSSDATVFINTLKLPRVAKVVGTHEDSLLCMDATTGKEVGTESLENYGLEIKGWVPGGDAENLRIKDKVEEALLGEAKFFCTLSPKLQRYLGERFPQKIRLLLWAGMLATITLVMTLTGGQSRGKQIDHSLIVNKLNYDQITPRGHGSIASNRLKAKGATFLASIPEPGLGKKHILSFEAKGLDFAKEISVFLNDEKIYDYRMNVDCVSRYCKTYVALGALDQKDNKIFVRHNFVDSDYVIRNLYVGPQQKVLPEELIVLEQRLQMAQRAYDERKIVTDNILTSEKEVNKILEFTARKSGADGIRRKATALLDLVKEQTSWITKTLWFSAQRNYKLSNFRESLKDYQKLSKFYTDPASPEAIQIREQISKVKGLL